MKKLKKVGVVFCILGFLFSGHEVLKIYHEYNKGEKIYTQLQKTVKIGEDVNVNLEELKKINPNCIGWIYIPNTNINYPIVQTENYQYVLKHTFDGTKNKNGSIFISKNNHKFLDRNTIIFGHIMKSGSMFANLHKYMDENFAKENPYIYLITEDGLQKYQIFSAYVTMGDSKTYTTEFTNKSFETYIKDCEENSEINMEKGMVSASDKIITLSTCMSRGIELERFVVHAVRT